ncbi:hypothetical protein [Pedobacter sp. ASV28]|uniref:hypothetical protein n=1 Tax=Pedobacter sp. ASV28 TaxID=2795123 RepID=UPI0018EA9E98|nr:hypothetical protein [Pedobacter sp. ASV28]
MKRVLSLIAIAAFGLSSSFAQTAVTTAKQAPKKVATATKTEAKKAEVKAVETKNAAATATKKEVKKVETKATAANSKLKADGSPDMRYKANKETKAVVAGPKKKDGTADMRFKANKEAAKKN